MQIQSNKLSAGTLTIGEPVRLMNGAELSGVEVAWASCGTLNEQRDNAVLIFHALTGDQYFAGVNAITGKEGWWSLVVGPGKAIDTNQYFVLCANVLGGCSGSTGPRSINPASGQRYGLSFPLVTIADMVAVQVRLLDHLGISRLSSVIGGSMGGMLALQFAASYPQRVGSCLAIATAARHSSQNIAFHELGRQAIMADPNWQGGNYSSTVAPQLGLAVARMAGHITYMSEEYLQSKFGRNLQNRDTITYGFEADFQVESYLRHQGSSFVARFDANSYLYLTRAMDYFDLGVDALASSGHSHAATPRLSDIFAGTPVRFCIMSFTSDWLFPTLESKAIVRGLNAALADVSFVEIEAATGHDSFLLECPDMFRTIRSFLGAGGA